MSALSHANGPQMWSAEQAICYTAAFFEQEEGSTHIEKTKAAEKRHTPQR